MSYSNNTSHAYTAAESARRLMAPSSQLSEFISREASVAFLSANVDGDDRLSFDEFRALIPSSEGMDEEGLQRMFSAVDTDQSGDISMNEYFIWALHKASSSGYGLGTAFRLYDSSGDGQVDLWEFAQACEDFGFGTLAHELFLELDGDADGTISYHEMTSMLESRSLVTGKRCKQFLGTLAFDEPGAVVLLDSVQWELGSVTTDEGLRYSLQESLLSSGAKPNDLCMHLTQVAYMTHVYMDMDMDM